jgi:hypothetical protein
MHPSAAGRFNVAAPARVALGALAAYVLVMATSSAVGRSAVEGGAPVPAARTMVSPQPVTPFRRGVIRDLGEQYEAGELRFGLSPHYVRGPTIAVGRDALGVSEAARTRDGRAFLSWSRFPRFTSERIGHSVLVRMSDLRYSDASGGGWASVVITVPDVARREEGGRGAGQ